MGTVIPSTWYPSISNKVQVWHLHVKLLISVQPPPCGWTRITKGDMTKIQMSLVITWVWINPIYYLRPQKTCNYSNAASRYWKFCSPIGHSDINTWLNHHCADETERFNGILIMLNDWTITVMSQSAWWHLTSPACHLFTQPFFQAQIKETIKAPCHWPLWGEFTRDQWIPLTNGQ